jgi:hypothetical protein
MKIKLSRSYTSKNGNKVFVYTVSGTETQIAEYKSAMGENYREDDETKEPLWFTTRCVGNSGNLIITKNNKVVADMSAFDQAASLAAQYGGNLGQELARAAAAQLIHSAPATVATPVAKSESIDNL